MWDESCELKIVVMKEFVVSLVIGLTNSQSLPVFPFLQLHV